MKSKESHAAVFNIVYDRSDIFICPQDFTLLYAVRKAVCGQVDRIPDARSGGNEQVGITYQFGREKFTCPGK